MRNILQATVLAKAFSHDDLLLTARVLKTILDVYDDDPECGEAHPYNESFASSLLYGVGTEDQESLCVVRQIERTLERALELFRWSLYVNSQYDFHESERLRREQQSGDDDDLSFLIR
jgi:hypothetical protein